MQLFLSKNIFSASFEKYTKSILAPAKLSFAQPSSNLLSIHTHTYNLLFWDFVGFVSQLVCQYVPTLKDVEEMENP